jgi:hypothetical protein
LPPSMRGRTSRPDKMIEFSAFMESQPSIGDYPPAFHNVRLSTDTRIPRVGRKTVTIRQRHPA